MGEREFDRLKRKSREDKKKFDSNQAVLGDDPGSHIFFNW